MSGTRSFDSGSVEEGDMMQQPGLSAHTTWTER